MKNLTLKYVEPFAVERESVFNFRIFSPSLAAEPRPVIEPVSIVDGENGAMVVTGHRTMAAAYCRGETVPAVVYPRSTPRESLIELALTREGAELSGVEKITAIFKTLCFAIRGVERCEVPASPLPSIDPPSELLAVYSFVLGRKTSTRFVVRIVNVLAFSSQELEALHTLRCPVEHMIPLLDLSARERRAWLRLRSHVVLSVGETKKLVEALLFARGSKKFDAEEWASRICDAPHEYRDGSAVLRSIRQRINPRLNAQHRRVAKTIKAMSLPNDVRLTPPGNLEGDSVSCYFKFSRTAQLEKYLDKLEGALKNGSVDELLRAINEDAPE